jgi:hypothetical protein
MDEEEIEIYRMLRKKYEKLKCQIYKILTSGGKMKEDTDQFGETLNIDEEMK